MPYQTVSVTLSKISWSHFRIKWVLGTNLSRYTGRAEAEAQTLVSQTYSDWQRVDFSPCQVPVWQATVQIDAHIRIYINIIYKITYEIVV